MILSASGCLNVRQIAVCPSDESKTASVLLSFVVEELIFLSEFTYSIRRTLWYLENSFERGVFSIWFRWSREVLARDLLLGVYRSNFEQTNSNQIATCPHIFRSVVREE